MLNNKDTWKFIYLSDKTMFLCTSNIPWRYGRNEFPTF